MNQICIAKKVALNNVEFLDFAVDDNDNLLLFEKFADASNFLKEEIGESEELLNYIITTVEAQKNNPRLQAVLNKDSVSGLDQETSRGTHGQVPPPSLTQKKNKEDLNVTFTLSCSDFEVMNNDSVIDKTTNKQLVPVVAFVDPQDPSQPVPVPNFTLTKVFVK